MDHLALDALIPVIQTAIGPVILISGVGLILLSLTNRYGRINDRARLLVRELRDSLAEREQITVQLDLLLRRARITRLAIMLAGTSVLLAGLLIISLFMGALLEVESGTLLIVLFILCVSSLVGSLVCFLMEVQTSLSALKVELSNSNMPVPRNTESR